MNASIYKRIHIYICVYVYTNFSAVIWRLFFAKCLLAATRCWLVGCWQQLGKMENQ